MTEEAGFYRIWDQKRARKTAEAPRENLRPLDPVTDSGYAATALQAECRAVAGAANGTRNKTLNTAAFSLGQLVAAGALPEPEVRARLSDAARAVGLDEHEIGPTITSGLGSGAQHPRQVPERDPLPQPTVLEPDQAVVDDLWASRPLLTHLHTYARARRVSPWAVLGCTLARVATATPFGVVLPPIVGSVASLNTFVGLVGRSGAGKGAAEAVAAEALDVGHIQTHTTGSGEGIAHGYKRRVRNDTEWHDDTHAVLFSVPEIDTLTALGGRQGATLLPELRRAWSGERLGFAYADPTKRLPIEQHQYRLCLIAGIQPGRARGLLEDTDAGTPQRFLWLPATDTDAPDAPPPAPSPLAWKRPRWRHDDFTTVAGRVALDVCPQAHDTIDQARLDRLRGNGDALDGHQLLAQLKVAALLGIVDGRLTVTDEDWELAQTVITKSNATRAGVEAALKTQAQQINTARAEAEAGRAVMVSQRLEDQAVKRVCSVIVRKLRRAEDWVSEGALRKALDSKDRGYFPSAIERLMDAGQVDAEEFSRGTKYRVKEESP